MIYSLINGRNVSKFTSTSFLGIITSLFLEDFDSFNTNLMLCFQPFKLQFGFAGRGTRSLHQKLHNQNKLKLILFIIGWLHVSDTQLLTSLGSGIIIEAYVVK